MGRLDPPEESGNLRCPGSRIRAPAGACGGALTRFFRFA
jgi:hypothetical protein